MAAATKKKMTAAKAAHLVDFWVATSGFQDLVFPSEPHSCNNYDANYTSDATPFSPLFVRPIPATHDYNCVSVVASFASNTKSNLTKEAEIGRANFLEKTESAESKSIVQQQLRKKAREIFLKFLSEEAEPRVIFFLTNEFTYNASFQTSKCLG